jgi:hypothetical protein
MNVTNPKGIPFNVPVVITYLGTDIIVILKSYDELGYLYDLLATNTPFFSITPNRLYVEGIKTFEVLEWTSLPLYVGWKHTTPLLANCIKKYNYKEQKAGPINRPDLGRD